MEKVKLYFSNGRTKELTIDTAELEIGRVVTLPASVGRYWLGVLVKWEVVG